MELPVIDEDAESVFNLLHRIFGTCISLTRSQYVESIRSTTVDPEVQLWIEVFVLTVEDWLLHLELNNYETVRIVREIERWVFKPSFGIDMISQAIDIAYRIDPDVFKKRFREWLRAHKPIRIKLWPAIQEPFESITEISEFI